MRKLSKVVLIIVFLFSFIVGTSAKEDSTKFNLADLTNSLDDVETLKLSHTKQAEAYKKGLGACYDFKYDTNVEESEDRFETITVETARERDNAVSEKEEEGYTVEVEGKEHETTTEEFEFSVFNDRVTGTTLDGDSINDYNNRTTSSVLSDARFTDYDTDDVRVVNTVTNNVQAINGSQVVTSNAMANFYAMIYGNQGYNVTTTQNNTERTNFEINSNRRLYEFQIRSRANTQAQQNNPNKEILDLRVDSTANSRVSNRTEYATRAEADSAAQTLRNSGLYESVVVSEEVDTNKDNATKTITKEEFDWTNNDYEPYTEDVHTGDIVTGYRNFYAEEVVVEPADTARIDNLSYGRCNNYLNSNQYASWINKSCERDAANSTLFNTRYVFTATKPAVTRMQGYYDEYTYAVKYIVTTYNYRYTGSYIATDYTVSYTGNRGTINIVKETTDKYYEVNGSRPLYTVLTNGTKEDNGSCTTTTKEEKTVNTGVRENSYKVLLVTSSLILFAIVLSKKRLCE